MSIHYRISNPRQLNQSWNETRENGWTCHAFAKLEGGKAYIPTTVANLSQTMTNNPGQFYVDLVEHANQTAIFTLTLDA